MIAQILWLASLPAVIIIAYKLTFLAYTYYESKGMDKSQAKT
jgi:hypothetical protein